MGLLDDLEEEANKRRESEEGALKHKREAFKELTIPAMENLYGYLQRLAKTLNFLKSERRASYVIPGYGSVVCRIESDMNVQAQMPMYSREIRLTVTAIIDASACPVIQVEGASRVEAMIEVFRRAGFDAMQKSEKDERGAYVSARFQAVGKIQMAASFSADMNSDQLRMEFANFDALLIRKQVLPISSINDEVLDSIGKYLAHQQNYVLRETVSNENRETWRAKLEAEEKKRSWEQKIASVQAAEEDKLRKSQVGRITGKFKSVTAEMAPKKPLPAATSPTPAANSGFLSKLSGLFGKKS